MKCDMVMNLYVQTVWNRDEYVTAIEIFVTMSGWCFQTARQFMQNRNALSIDEGMRHESVYA